MYKKLLFLTSVVLVLGLAGNASAYHPDLMAWWAFDNDYNSPVPDPCSFNWNGDPNGPGVSITQTPGNYVVGSGALKLDSDTSSVHNYVDVGSASDPVYVAGPNSPVVRSISGWYKYEDISSNGSQGRNFVWETTRCLPPPPDNGQFLSFGIRTIGSDKRAQFYNSGLVALWPGGDDSSMSSDADEGPIADDGQWHHAVQVWNKAKGYSAGYIDGELFWYEIIDPCAEADLLSDGINIGDCRDENIGTRKWDGYIDDVALYRTALRGPAARALYEGQFMGQDVNAGNVLDIVKYYYAENPYPFLTATEVPIDVNLSWAPGFEGNAAYHDVYFGTDYSAVFSATDPNTLPGRGRQPLDANTYNPPGDLSYGTTYYWRIDEVNEPNVWKGDMWWFYTIDYPIIVDDMESYSDDSGDNPIFNTWEDWIGGSQVIIETTEVRSGQQSMEFTYNNSITPYYSEIERRYKSPQNWTLNNVKALGLYFKGTSDPPNDAEQMYLGLADSTHLDDPCVVTYDRPLSNLRNDDWQRWDIDLQDFTDAGVDLTDVNQIFIGFGDRDNPSAGGTHTNTIYFDDIRLYVSRCIPDRIPANFNGSSDCMVDSEDLDAMTDSWLIPANYNLTTKAPDSNNLVNWWKFDEGAGTTAADDGTAGNNGSFPGGALDPTWVAGMTGDPCDNALLFDGVDDAVVLGSPLTIFSSSFTISTWVKVPFTATGRVGIILGDDKLTNAISVNFELHDDGEIRFYWAGSPDLRGTTDLRDDSWHLVTFVRDKATEKVYGYVDGNPDFEYSGAIDDKTATIAHRIGRDLRDGDTAFKGAIDDIRIYSYALSHAEVGYLALQGGTPLSVPMPPYAVKVDIVQDNKINLKDYVVLAEKWLVEQTWP